MSRIHPVADSADGGLSLPSFEQLSGNRCGCRSCGFLFRSRSMFDRHRVGELGSRRCLSVREMLERGFSPDPKGYWRIPARGRGRRSLASFFDDPGEWFACQEDDVVVTRSRRVR
jgi:hypothetical protein